VKHPYLPLTENDRADMMQAIGVKDFEEIVANIPANLRKFAMDLPEPAGEMDLMREISDLINASNSKKHLSFLGAGTYEHFIPSIVPFLAFRSEFYTSYTPYQAEASQGSLQVMYEYQSLICALTGMDVSNASHYDGATATAEAVLMAITHTNRTKVLVARSLHPDYRAVTQTYIHGRTAEISEVKFTKSGALDVSDLAHQLDINTAALVVQTPNFFGLLEDLTEVERLVHRNGSLLILVSNPLSLGVCRTPAEWNADVACGEGQPLGIPQFFGGPYLGYFTVKKDLMRKIPGRLCGITKDCDGVRSFVLTLQAREQHIRRERAASNICTNEALCALMACIYMVALGQTGIERVGAVNVEKANELRAHLSGIPGIKLHSEDPIFNEFVIQTTKPSEKILEGLKNSGIFGGVSLKPWYPELGESILLCATETKTDKDLDRLVSELKKLA
jgi:glycine dehydrogenase subunit 1